MLVMPRLQAGLTRALSDSSRTRSWAQWTDVPAEALATVHPGTAADHAGVGRAAVADASRAVSQLRIGILTPADTGESFNSALLVGDALARRGVAPIWLDSDTTRVVDGAIRAGGRDVGPLDFVVTRYVAGHGVATMEHLERQGVPLLNSLHTIRTTISKVATQGAYETYGAPTITTRFAGNVHDADEALRGLPDQVVVKPFDGEGGRGVEFFDDHASAKRHIADHFSSSDTMLLVQERVPGATVQWTTAAGERTESGMDYRTLITRDRRDMPFVHTILQRIGAPGSGRSNLDGGGWGRNVPVEEAPQGLLDAGLAGFNAIPGHPGQLGVDVIPVGRARTQSLDDHAAQAFKDTETNSSPGIPDVLLGRDFAGAVAEHAITVASR